MVMISLICRVNNQRQMRTLEKTLSNFEADKDTLRAVYCVCNEEMLEPCTKYYERFKASDDRTFKVIEGGFLSASGSAKTDLVFLMNNEVVIPAGGLTELYRIWLLKPTLGFVTGRFMEYAPICKVADCYAEAPEFSAEYELGNENLAEIDVYPTYGMLTPTNLYEELFCLSELPNYRGLSYGARLKRLGYGNYLLSNLEYRCLGGVCES